MSGFEGSDIRTMVMFGQGEDATHWVDVSSKADVTKFLLFPAAKYGQLDTLKKFIDKGYYSKLNVSTNLATPPCECISYHMFGTCNYCSYVHVKQHQCNAAN